MSNHVTPSKHTGDNVCIPLRIIFKVLLTTYRRPSDLVLESAGAAFPVQTVHKPQARALPAQDPHPHPYPHRDNICAFVCSIAALAQATTEGTTQFSA